MSISERVAEYFDFEEYETTYRTELIAGLTTFLAMSYIIAVNPQILADAILADEAMADAYSRTQIVEMLAVVTILASVIATVVMAFYAKRPFGLAPGMGLNAFFTYTVVVGLGIPWQTALAAVFVEGIIFILLTAVGARRYLIELFPEPVKRGVGAGIGAFLLFLGLQEMNVVVSYPDGTLVQMGNIASDPVAIVAVVGLFLTFILWARDIRGSIVIGILTTALAGWALALSGVSSRLAPEAQQDAIESDGLTGLLGAEYDFSPLFGAFYEGLQDIDPVVFALVVFTFFFVDFFDTAGTLIGVSQIGGFLDSDGNLPEMEKPLMADAVGTTAGSILGTSTITTFIESSTGLEEGGRTGFTALAVSGFFLLSLLAVPLISAIPAYASYLALVVVGVIMLQGVVDIDWQDPAWAISGGLTILVMPMTTSIADGIAAGIIAYPIIKTAMGQIDETRPGQWILAFLFIIYYYVTTSGLLESMTTILLFH
ncbi:NCS2 family permease [Salinarchaeum sp. IM2453]|uniref:NCS2 family permease n=1 Tax=Salinarchaeum sp. IM2453 TaxID=2862870 RepID=UPI001C83715A|nr:NCS2 family permease [Salinarchaeum sp. IM2453]QZA89620.1 NCS2 family permease [Salinarchaeum sp. IM2453]